MENKLASLLVVPLEKALNGIPHFRLVHKWSATPKRACDSVLIVFTDRRINMQLNIIRHKIIHTWPVLLRPWQRLPLDI